MKQIDTLTLHGTIWQLLDFGGLRLFFFSHCKDHQEKHISYIKGPLKRTIE